MINSHLPKTRLTVVLPVALTQLYFKGWNLRPVDCLDKIPYDCVFEDDPQKIREVDPDVKITMAEVPSGFRLLEKDKLRVIRVIVASPELIKDASIIKPIDLESFPYATLNRSGSKYFYVTTQAGETMVVEPRSSFGSNGLFAAHEAAKHGIAFAVLPKFMVTDDLDEGVLISLLSAWPTQPYIIQTAISSNCECPESARHLISFLLEKLKTIPGINIQK